jgi:hypothetical protein
MVVWLKRALVQASVGAVFGFVLWCLLGKSMTSMLFGSLGGSFSCRTDVELGLDKFVSMQLYSAIAGALVAFAGATFVRLRWMKPKAKLARAAAAATPTDPRTD